MPLGNPQPRALQLGANRNLERAVGGCKGGWACFPQLAEILPSQPSGRRFPVLETVDSTMWTASCRVMQCYPLRSSSFEHIPNTQPPPQPRPPRPYRLPSTTTPSTTTPSTTTPSAPSGGRAAPVTAPTCNPDGDYSGGLNTGTKNGFAEVVALGALCAGWVYLPVRGKTRRTPPPPPGQWGSLSMGQSPLRGRPTGWGGCPARVSWLGRSRDSLSDQHAWDQPICLWGLPSRPRTPAACTPSSGSAVFCLLPRFSEPTTVEQPEQPAHE